MLDAAIACTHLYQSRSQSSQKRVCPITPSLRFPLLAGGTEPTRGSPREAGGTEPTRGSPREAGGTLRRGAIVNSALAIGIRQGTLRAGAATPPRGAARSETGFVGGRLLSEALEALSPSVGGDVGELGKEQAHLGLGACTERDEGEQEPVEAVESASCGSTASARHISPSPACGSGGNSAQGRYKPLR
jgi:hypothetical protein